MLAKAGEGDRTIQTKMVRILAFAFLSCRKLIDVSPSPSIFSRESGRPERRNGGDQKAATYLQDCTTLFVYSDVPLRCSYVIERCISM